MSNQSEPAPLTRAMHATMSTLEKRARLHRNQVIVFVMLILGCALAAAVLRSCFPLMGLVLLIGVNGFFLWLDARCLQRWHLELGKLCAHDGVSMELVQRALASIPNAPTAALEEMYNSFPAEARAAGGWPREPEQQERLLGEIARQDRKDQGRVISGAVSATAMICTAAVAGVFRTVPTIALAVAAFIVWALVRRAGRNR